jgi:hypothetical protein
MANKNTSQSNECGVDMEIYQKQTDCISPSENLNRSLESPPISTYDSSASLNDKSLDSSSLIINNDKGNDTRNNFYDKFNLDKLTMFYGSR